MKTEVIVILDLSNLVIEGYVAAAFPVQLYAAVQHGQSQQVVLVVDRCFMWYVDKIMQFINRNAYIIVAVKGSGYCTSAGRAIKLIVNNALRLVAVNIIVDVVVW